jgi:hypothetical protein
MWYTMYQACYYSLKFKWCDYIKPQYNEYVFNGTEGLCMAEYFHWPSTDR